MAGLPEGLPTMLVVVQHLDPRHRSLMAEIPSRRTSLKVILRNQIGRSIPDIGI